VVSGAAWLLVMPRPPGVSRPALMWYVGGATWTYDALRATAFPTAEAAKAQVDAAAMGLGPKVALRVRAVLFAEVLRENEAVLRRAVPVLTDPRGGPGGRGRG